ncbi:hypothetical protein TcCL_ESM05889 [Trypanosoma cruzi]|nr:hypothetical protein TcCL_ESM05889 [Trypanosoma cruzi]
MSREQPQQGSRVFAQQAAAALHRQQKVADNATRVIQRALHPNPPTLQSLLQQQTPHSMCCLHSDAARSGNSSAHLLQPINRAKKWLHYDQQSVQKTTQQQYPLRRSVPHATGRTSTIRWLLPSPTPP